METNGFLPEGINLFPRLTRVAKEIGHFLTGPHLLASHGDHFVKERGAAAQLDAQLYDQPTEMLYADPTHEPLNRWDSEGRYFEE